MSDSRQKGKKMYDFSNQVVMVTGGTGNVGKAAVEAFAGAGAALVVPDRKVDRLASEFPALAGSSSHFLAEGFDVTSEQGMDGLVSETLDRLGRIDVLVHTIGGFRAGRLPHETSLETWDHMLNLNGRVTFLVNRAVVPTMIRQKRGRIINFAARPALAGGADDVAYSASKSAVARITESMAAAYRHDGITVNAIIPGTIDSPQNRAANPQADFKHWVTPEEIARIVLFLAAEDARMINGSLIPTVEHHGENL